MQEPIYNPEHLKIATVKRKRFTAEEWDEKTADLHADVERRFLDKKYLSFGMGVVDSVTKHFDEMLQDYLDYPEKSKLAFWLRLAANVYTDDTEKRDFLDLYRQRIEAVRDGKAKVISVDTIYERGMLKRLLSELEAPATTPPPATDEQDNEISVYSVAAMCYYLGKAGWITEFVSKAKFIKAELIPKYGYSFPSINNKCSQMNKPDFRNKQKGAIKKAIVLMETTEAFNIAKAILLAKADCT